MSRRERRRSRLDRDAVEENERSRGSSSKPVVFSDDEANEDLSLQIVEKALLMRASKLFPDENGVVSPERAGIEDSEVSASRSKKSATRKVVKKKKVKKSGIEDKDDIVINEVEDKSKMVEETSVAVESNPAKDTDNLVLRKLLRGPRYFDPPDSSWGACYNCGEEGHAAVNCTSARRIKPCFVCGSLEHNVKQCTKGQDCYICKKTGHRAKDCPDKYKSISATSKICLKCGDSGHDMFSCRSDYDLEDLTEICCYVCKKLGHLCCANYVDSCPKEVSCYRCGQMGHTGLSCTRKRGGEASNMEQVSSCFKCGEEGHFARECTKGSSKNGKRNREPSTPTLKPHREHRHDKGHKSAPHDLGKGSHKKKKTQHEESSYNTPRKPKQRGGWITEDPIEYSYDRKNYGSDRRSPNGNRTPYMRNGGYVSTPNSYDNWTHYPHGNQEYHEQGYHRFQNSRSRSSRTNEFPWNGYPNGGSNGGGRSSRNYGW